MSVWYGSTSLLKPSLDLSEAICIPTPTLTARIADLASVSGLGVHFPGGPTKLQSSRRAEIADSVKILQFL
jgi:hypothetical protein